jgi:hypothetical protein
MRDAHLIAEQFTVRETVSKPETTSAVDCGKLPVSDTGEDYPAEAVSTFGSLVPAAASA